jgi:glutamate racemase
VVADTRPIGLFDSGAGGLHVASAVHELLPAERLVYVADTARLPFGPRPPAELRAIAAELAAELLARGAKLLVVACNSAESAAWDSLRDQLAATAPVPVVGVIGPAAGAALAATRNGRIGLIGTEATVAGGAYQRALARLAPGREVTLLARAAPALGELLHRPGPPERLLAAVSEAVGPLLAAGIDTLILGCTAYPLAEDLVRAAAGPGVTLVSSAGPTAAAVAEALAGAGLAAPGAGPGGGHEVLVSGDLAAFEPLARAVARFEASVRPLGLSPAARPGP